MRCVVLTHTLFCRCQYVVKLDLAHNGLGAGAPLVLQAVAQVRN